MNMRASCFEKPTGGERANPDEKPKRGERAMAIEKPTRNKRAITKEKPITSERAPYTFEDILAVRMLVRAREDFQSLRKKMDNRLGRKADGTDQNIDERAFRIEDVEMFKNVADAAHDQEADIQKNLKRVLKRFPVYTEYLQGVKGVGEIAAGWIIAEFDINRAETVSKMWQFAGLNPGMVLGHKDVPVGEYKTSMGREVRRYTKADGKERVIFETDTMIRGDRLTPGFVAPFNKRFRTALAGVMADGFIKQQNEYCLKFYYPYKERLANSEREVMHVGKMTAWKDTTPGHRDRAAKRYMIKMFIKDLYVAWRTLEGLPVREPYMEEYLGKRHSA